MHIVLRSFNFCVNEDPLDSRSVPAVVDIVVSLFESVTEDLVVPFAGGAGMTDNDGRGTKLSLCQRFRGLFWLVDAPDEISSLNMRDSKPDGRER